MIPFQPADYGPSIASLLSESRLNDLGPGKPNELMRAKLEQLTTESMFVQKAKVNESEMAKCCLAGLWLYHDFLEESHELSQTIKTPSGSYWHGIMHRREPDYGNAKYWFRRVGDHPVFAELGVAAQQLAKNESIPDAAQFLIQPAWDPFAFVDLCEASAAGRASCETFCRRVQQREWEMLFDYCYHASLGK